MNERADEKTRQKKLERQACGKSLVMALSAGLAWLVAALPAAAQVAQTRSAPEGQATIAPPTTIASEFAKLPLMFEKNQGQSDSSVKFLSRGPGYTLLLTGQGAIVRLTARAAQSRKTGPDDSALLLRLGFAGANPNAEVLGEDELPGKTNYIVGDSPKNWRTNIPNYSRVAYRGVYPGIDAVFHGNPQHLEFDFNVAPGADPNQIALDVSGANSCINDSGDIVLDGGGTASEVMLQQPVVFQYIGRMRHEVPGHFILRGSNRISFKIGAYDHSRALVIDPTLSYSYNAPGGYSTMYGAMDSNVGPTVSVDAAGEVVLVGLTFDAALETTQAPSTCPPGTPQGSIICDATSVYIAKLNATGTALLFATYFGGSKTAAGFAGGESTALGALDSNNDIFVAGQLNAVDLPLLGALSTSQPVSTNYLAKFNSSGQLVYSTYLGQTDMILEALAADGAGDAFVGGAANTSYTDVPQINPLPLSCTTTCNDGFILGVNPEGSAFMYGTYVGGSFGNQGNGNTGYEATVESLATYSVGGNFLALGAETSFPDISISTQAYQTSGNGYVALLDLNGSGTSQYVYATYLGGGGITAVGLAPGTGGSYLSLYAGGLDSPELVPWQTTPGAFEPLPDYGFSNVGTTGPGNAYVARFSVSSPAVVTTNYVSYLGGNNQEGTTITAITGDSNGNTWVAGQNVSPDFPVVDPLFPNCSAAAPNPGTCQAFITEINPSGTALLFSTLFAGNTQESISGLAVDASNNVYVGGWTASTNFPTTANALQSSCVSAAFGNVCPETWFAMKLTSQPAPTGPNLVFSLNGPKGPPLTVGSAITFPPTFTSFNQAQVITVTNAATSGPPLTVTGTLVAGQFISPYEYYDFTAEPAAAGNGTGDQPCMPNDSTTYQIAAGQSCDITVLWTPHVTLTESSVLQVFDNSANIFSPQYFTLNGTSIQGAGATLTPNPLLIGNVLQGRTLSGNITIASTGDQALSFNSSPAISASPDFTITSNTCSSSLPQASNTNQPGGTCQVGITYTANGTPGATETATLTVADNSAFPASPQTASITATTVLPLPQMVVSPSSVLTGINFSATGLNLPSGTVSFQIQNLGPAALSFISPPFSSGTNALDFHESDTCVANNPLPSFSSCTISVYFQPTQAGATETAVLNILTNDPTTPTVGINLSGQSATPPGPPTILPILASVDNSVPPQSSTVGAGLSVISNGGRFIAFWAPVGSSSGSNSNLPNPPQANSGAGGLYLRDTCNGASATCTQSTEFIAYNPSGAPCYFQQYDSPGAVYSPAITTDGRFVAFTDDNCFSGSSSAASPPTPYIFLRDTQAQTTTQITDQGATPITGPFSMSANTQYFAFTSTTESVQRSAGDTSDQVYVNDTAFSDGAAVGTPATLLVSEDNTGTEDRSSNKNGFQFGTPAISPDGRFVAFASPWDDFKDTGTIAGDGSMQVYLRDTCLGAPQTTPPCAPKTILISSPDNAGTFGSGGSSGNAYSYNGTSTPAMAVSAGGRYVAFMSMATNLPQPANGSGTYYPGVIYLRDTCQSNGQPITGCGTGGTNPGTITPLATNGYGLQISGDGRIISFVSIASLVANAPPTALYAYDTCLSNGQPVSTTPPCQPGLLGVVSATLTNGQAVQAEAFTAALDGTGQFVTYMGPSSEVYLNATGVVTQPPLTISPATLPNGGVGISYSQTITASGPASLTVAGTLPPGLTLTQSGTSAARLSGTPTSSGSFNFTITATSTANGSATQPYTVAIEPPLTITPSSLPEGGVNVSYSETITASNPATFGLTSGTLAPGLSLTASGKFAATLSGTPTTAGTASFTIMATSDIGATTSQSYTLMIEPQLTISPASLPNGNVGASYSQTITSNDPVTFTVTGTLPTGLTLTTTGQTAATVSGTPTATGSFAFTVTATDDFGTTASQSYTVVIDSSTPPPPVTVTDTETITVTDAETFPDDAETITVTDAVVVHALDPSIVQLGISPSGPIPDGESVTLTANITSSISGISVTPTGTVTFAMGSATVGTAALIKGAATLVTSALPPGSDTITASYGGDINFTASSSSAETITVNPDYKIGANPSALQLAAGESGTTTITVTPEGFAGSVTVSCGSLPSYISCAFNPSSGSLSFNAGSTTPQTLTLTIHVASSLGALPADRALMVAMITPLGLLGLVLIFTQENRRPLGQRASLATLALVLVMLMASCGGSGSGMGNGVTLPPAGAQTVTISASGSSPSGKISHQLQLTVTITN